MDLIEATTRIQMEYLEMPELRLTRAQAQRLWNLTPEVCAAALSMLIGAGALRRADDGTYLRGAMRIITESPQRQ
jgi:hypothetical protein